MNLSGVWIVFSLALTNAFCFVTSFCSDLWFRFTG